MKNFSIISFFVLTSFAAHAASFEGQYVVKAQKCIMNDQPLDCSILMLGSEMGNIDLKWDESRQVVDLQPYDTLGQKLSLREYNTFEKTETISSDPNDFEKITGTLSVATDLSTFKHVYTDEIHYSATTPPAVTSTVTTTEFSQGTNGGFTLTVHTSDNYGGEALISDQLFSLQREL